MRFFLIILISIICINAKSQADYSVTNIKLSYDKVNEDINIVYDVLPLNSNARFKIVPEIYFKNGQKIYAASFEGEGIETYTNCGNGKIIKWKPAKDKIRINEEIYVTLNAYREINIKAFTHLLKSGIMPGWGDYKLFNGRYYAGFGIISYGALAGAVLYNRMAAETYSSYKNSFEIEQSNKLYTEARNQQKISNILAISSAAVWAVDLARVYIKSKKVKKDIKQSNYYYTLSNQTFSNRSGNFWLDNRTPFDIALQEGDKAFKTGLYNEAQLKYQTALKLEPENSNAQFKLDETNRILAEIKAKEEKYQTLIITADSLFKVNDFVSAKANYSEATGLIPGKVYPQHQLNEIAKIQEKERKEKEYKEIIAEADETFKKKNFEKATQLYQKAMTILPDELYPSNKIQECENEITQNKYNMAMDNGNHYYKTANYEMARYYYQEALRIKSGDITALSKLDGVNKKIAEIKQIRLDKEYKDNITNADNAFDNKEYDKAKGYYQTASNIKPSETYPKNRIESINKKNEIKTIENKDLSTLYEKNKEAVFLIFSEDYSTISQGSGFFISSSGFAITNEHVFRGSYFTKNYIQTSDGEKYQIETDFCKKDKELDYVIFKIIRPTGKTFPYLKCATSLPKIGEDVFAIGNPEGLEQTLSKGIITSYRENNTLIQTDAPITRGSSGGPLFNMNGEVIGITTMGKQEGNLFFALSILKVPYISCIK